LSACAAGITLSTTLSLPHCAPRCVPGWRPCGSSCEVTSDYPLRCAVHGAWRSERRRVLIAIVPSPCRDGGNATWATAWGGGVCRRGVGAACLASLEETPEAPVGFRGLATPG